jgi:hypothetical protein
MGILEKARTLESRIAHALSRAAGTAVGATAREPLEIVHAIVDAVEREIQSGSRGTRLFPYNNVIVSAVASSQDARARLDAVFSGEPSLRERFVQRLESAGCVISDLQVEVAYVGRASRAWADSDFHVVFDRVAPVAPAEPIDRAPGRIEVTVLRGAAEQRTYAFAASRIEFGRGPEVRDNRNRLLRTNHIVFIDGSPAENQTVSRRHAHIAYDPSSGGHRLYDDGSVHGSGIVRSGRTIPVPPGARGVRVRSGDEIVLGEARLRIRIDSPR